MSTESKTIAENLAQHWIKHEQQYRAQVTEARTAGTPHSGMVGHADHVTSADAKAICEAMERSFALWWDSWIEPEIKRIEERGL